MIDTFFKTKIRRASVLFLWPVIPMLLISDGIYTEFQSHRGFLLLHALSSLCNRFLTFTSDATPADLFVTSMAAEPF